MKKADHLFNAIIMNTKGRKESRMKRCMKAPIRVLIKARDCYVHSLMDCSGRVGYGSAMGLFPVVPQISSLPRNFSTNSSVSSGDEDFRELKRIASKSRLDQTRQSPVKNEVNVMSRNSSVAIGRIDEDEPCDFGREDVKVNTDVFPRSRNYYGVSSKRARMH